MVRDYRKLYEKKLQECKKLTEKYNKCVKEYYEIKVNLRLKRREISTLESFLPKKKYKIVYEYKNNSGTFITDACHYNIAILKLKKEIMLKNGLSFYDVEVEILSIEVLAY